MAFDVSRKGLYERDFWLFLSEVITASKDVHNLTKVHKEWCREFQKDYGERRRYMLLKPRGTYKTTIYVIAYACWLFVRNPDRTILLVSATGTKADENYRAIKNILMTNPRLLECWGRLWDSGRSRFTLKGIWHRYRSPDDPNFQTPNIRSVGKGATITGQHYDSIFPDDIVNEDDRDSPTEREKTKAFFRMLQPILNDDAPGEIIITGTRWHFDDLYHHIEFELNKGLRKDARFVCEIEGLYEMDKERWRTHGELKYLTDAQGRFILRFPEKYGYEKIEEMKETMGLSFFYAQMLNNPTPSEAVGFPRENLELFKPTEMGDRIKELDIITYWDPTTSEKDTLKVCYSSIITVGFDRKTNELFVLAATLEKMNTPTGVLRARDHIMAFSPRIFAYEASGDPVLLDKELRNMLIELGLTKTRLQRVPTYHGGHTKDARIEMMSNMYDLGFIKFRNDWKNCLRWHTYNLLVDQLINWPLHTYKDGPDALAGCIEVLDIPRMGRKARVSSTGGRFTKTVGERFGEQSGPDATREQRAERQRRGRQSVGIHPLLRNMFDTASKRRRR